MIEAEQRTSKTWELTPEGQEIIHEGSHEVRVFNSIPSEGLLQSELMVKKKSSSLYTYCFKLLPRNYLFDIICCGSIFSMDLNVSSFLLI